jgi:hypothetical protein
VAGLFLDVPQMPDARMLRAKLSDTNPSERHDSRVRREAKFRSREPK